MKFLSRIVSLVLTIFLFIGAFSVTANAASNRQEVLGVAFVTASALRLRSGAGTNTATLDYASQNEVVVLLERIGDWYKVNYNLQIGFMHKNYLRTVTIGELRSAGWLNPPIEGRLSEYTKMKLNAMRAANDRRKPFMDESNWGGFVCYKCK